MYRTVCLGRFFALCGVRRACPNGLRSFFRSVVEHVVSCGGYALAAAVPAAAVIYATIFTTQRCVVFVDVLSSG